MVFYEKEKVHEEKRKREKKQEKQTFDFAISGDNQKKKGKKGKEPHCFHNNKTTLPRQETRRTSQCEMGGTIFSRSDRILLRFFFEKSERLFVWFPTLSFCFLLLFLVLVLVFGMIRILKLCDDNEITR